MRLNTRALLAYVHDLVMTAASLWLALYLRLGDAWVYYDPVAFVPAWLVLIAAAAVIYQAMGLYRGIWRYASLDDLIALTRAVTLVIAIFLIANFAWTRLDLVPRSLPFIMWFIMMALLGGPRFIYRAMKDRRVDLRRSGREGEGIPVLLAGAGDGTEMFLRHVNRSGDGAYRVIGIVAENQSRVGRRIHGVEVLGTTADLGRTLKLLSESGRAPQRVILTKDDFDGPTVTAMLETATKAGATLARLPRLTDLRDHAQGAIEVRPVAVEDLLGRPQTPLDRSAMATLIQGRRVLITGAGGSIGSELVRQVSDLEPAHVAVLDAAEYNLYSIDQELLVRHATLSRDAILADVRDADAVRRAMARAKPDIVFHAAALKHVPLVENHPDQGVRTNVMGTMNVAKASIRSGVSSFVLISTDKAVNPTSVMGATKRIAERICQGLDLQDGPTRFVTVRFGNVLGSTGSVVPLFQKQLAAGGPLTVTHPDMTRYFMTIREAVELVLEASALGEQTHATDTGAIHVLDMGSPVKIMDLAEQMIRLAGFEPGREVSIKIVGVRPGEKIHEEVFHGDEAHVPTNLPGILLARPRAVPLSDIQADLDLLIAAAEAADIVAVDIALHTLVPEYVKPTT